MSFFAGHFVCFADEKEGAVGYYEDTLPETAAERFLEERYYEDEICLTNEDEFEVFVRRSGEDKQVKYSVILDTKPVFYAEEAEEDV